MNKRTFLLLVAIASLPASALRSDEKPDAITVATWNVEWFYDHYKGDNASDLSKQQSAPGRPQWEWKLNEVARVVAALHPTIMCFQEIENQNVLWQLTQKLKNDHNLQYRIAFIQGTEFFTEQDVGIIYQSGLVEYSRREQTSEMFSSHEFYNVSKHVFARFQWGHGDQQETLLIANVHFRAKPEAADLRKRQAKLIRHWMQESIEAGENVLALGDFNTEEDFGAETADGEVALLRGLDNAAQKDDGSPLFEREGLGVLVDAHKMLESKLRPTHLSGRQYDRIFYSPSLARDAAGKSDLVVTRAVTRRDLVVKGEQDGEEHWQGFWELNPDDRDVSDHYPLMIELVFK